MTNRSNTPTSRRAWTKPQVIVGQTTRREPEGKTYAYAAEGRTTYGFASYGPS